MLRESPPIYFRMNDDRYGNYHSAIGRSHFLGSQFNRALQLVQMSVYRYIQAAFIGFISRNNILHTQQNCRVLRRSLVNRRVICYISMYCRLRLRFTLVRQLDRSNLVQKTFRCRGRYGNGKC